MFPPHDMARCIDRQQHDIDVTQHVPHEIRRVVPIVAPIENSKIAGFHHDYTMVPGPGIIGRFDVDAFKFFDESLEIIDRR